MRFFKKISLWISLFAVFLVHQSLGQSLPDWISEIGISNLEIVCEFESSKNVFFVLRTSSEIVTAERILVTDGKRAPDHFSVGWKLFSQLGHQLYLEEPESTVSRKVVRTADGFFVQHLTSYKPVSDYSDPIRIELRFKTIESTDQDPTFSSLPLLGECTVPWGS